jgi:hypothetical protein
MLSEGGSEPPLARRAWCEAIFGVLLVVELLKKKLGSAERKVCDGCLEVITGTV